MLSDHHRDALRVLIIISALLLAGIAVNVVAITKARAAVDPQAIGAASYTGQTYKIYRSKRFVKAKRYYYPKRYVYPYKAKRHVAKRTYRKAIRHPAKRPTIEQPRNIFTQYAATSKGSKSLTGVVAPLAAKAREIVSACGSIVISAVRNTFVRGTGRKSLHASGEAVDMQGNPSCIYARLRNWPGGYSIDYSRVRHVHISHGKREWGARFAHYGARRHTRYAARNLRREASAQ